MAAQQSTQIHVFENAGMGKAPFKLIGFYALPSKSLAEQNPSAYQNALAAMPRGVGCGSCAYCGTALVNNFIIESADGNKSAVGCDCVEKTGDRGLTDTIKLKKRELAREKRAAARQAKWQAEEEKREAELERQRQNNGGLTDAEIHQQKIAALEEQFETTMEDIIESLKPLLTAIRPKKESSSFVRNVGHYIYHGELYNISVNMWRIITDIAAKQTGGRSNSKKYKADYERYDAMISSAIERYIAAKNKFEEDKKAL